MIMKIEPRKMIIRNTSTTVVSNKRWPPLAIDSINKLRNVQIFGQMEDMIMNDRLVGQITA